jgi:ubiquinone biosynthesis protein COQ9
MEQILENIEKSIPENLKADLKKRIATATPILLQLSNQLKQMAINNYDVRSVLFKNSEDAIYFSGDILAKTLHDYWIKRDPIKEIFIENAQATAFYAGFECVW